MIRVEDISVDRNHFGVVYLSNRNKFQNDNIKEYIRRDDIEEIKYIERDDIIEVKTSKGIERFTPEGMFAVADASHRAMCLI